MKLILFILIPVSYFLTACQSGVGRYDELTFDMPAVPYATNAEAVKKKEFSFPSVPYAK